MTWINYQEAVKKIEKDAREKGAHVFYSHYKKSYQVIKASRNKQVIGDRISESTTEYLGFYDKNLNIFDVMEDLIYVATR